MAEVLHEEDAPPAPGFWRIGWLLFMQPLTLHRLFAAWGLEKALSLRELRNRLKEKDLAFQALVRLGGWLLLIMPASALVVVASCLKLVGLPINWPRVAGGVASGVVLGIVRGTFGISKTFGILGDFAIGITAGVALGVWYSLTFSPSIPGAIAGGVAQGFVLSIVFSCVVALEGRTANVPRGIAVSLAFCIIFAFLASLSVPFGGLSVTRGLAGGVAFEIVFLLFLFHLPFFPIELTLTALLHLIARVRPALLPRLASCLAYRHHDLIYLPLPFLASFLVQLAKEHPVEGRRALTEASASTGQKGPARRALMELQARSLERAARERQYASAAALSLPFLPGREGSRSLGDPRNLFELASDQLVLITLNSIAAAAQDLEAARSTGSYYQRRQALTRAGKELERTLDLLTTARARNRRRFLSVVKAWLDRVEDEETALAALELKQPQVPLVFVAGVPLTPQDESLFKGRRDLVRLLDQDLAAERPVPLVLLGQRRMGKSTLLNFLPRLLGTGTRVVHLDFQGLSGHPLRSTPHRWVAAEVSAALTSNEFQAAARPSEKAPWGTTLDWLATLEEPLAAAGRRLLIALDEVEGLERGIREGWSDPAFLDFLRAAGDRLHRSRFLLVTAHPFSRLGPHWSDRLISAQTRRIEPLGENEARELLTEPVDRFPDIYPPGGVERLLTETACHPYLLQLTAYHLTRRLNDAGRLKATEDDLTAALDQVLEENNLFQYLWNDLAPSEQRLLAALARGEGLPEAASEGTRDLAREQLIQRSGPGEGWQVTVPLFARWIREIGSAE
jgi:hypothetical protein